MTESEYDKLTRPYARALRRLTLDFEFFVADAGNLNVFSLSGRIKSYTSAMEKQIRLGIDVKDLQDIAGIRMVLATSDEVDVIAEFLKTEHNLKKLAINSDKRVDKADGYRSRHIILSVGPGITHSVFDATVEVQLQTILEHAYNFVSRAWVYKSNRELSVDWRARFQNVSLALEKLNTAIAELHADVLEAASNGTDDEPLTPFSFQRIVHDSFGERVSLDEAVWHTRFLIDLHCGTNGDTRRFFKSAEILALHRRVANLKGDGVLDKVRAFATMPMYAFFTFMGVRLEASHQLLDSLEQTAHEEGGA